MPSVDATIASSAGLHARPASIFIDAVKKQSVPVTIAKDGGRAADHEVACHWARIRTVV